MHDPRLGPKYALVFPPGGLNDRANRPTPGLPNPATRFDRQATPIERRVQSVHHDKYGSGAHANSFAGVPF
ncbi:hypothetical protein MICRO8M_90092 [Microbacterium sp. 8M]|nr:hypothetical protein MICRO8M_90092 [Microbacterium sp. 8M]